jgi:hypothetical protein
MPELIPHLPPTEIALITHWVGGWVGSKADMNAVEERKISCLVGNQILISEA